MYVDDQSSGLTLWAWRVAFELGSEAFGFYAGIFDEFEDPIDLPVRRVVRVSTPQLLRN